MAEFCLECQNKAEGRNKSAAKYILSEDLQICEGCGEWKNVIVAEKQHSYLFFLLNLICKRF